MSLTFEWNLEKAEVNARKHDVSFEEAATCFRDLQSLTVHDPDHSDVEDRYVLLGLSAHGKLLVVVHSERGDNIRLISARPANRREAAIYSQNQ